MVLRLEPVLLDKITDVHRQLALVDAVAGVFAGIGRRRDHLEALDAGLEVEVQLFGQRVQAAGQCELCIVVDAALQVDACAAIRCRRETADAAADLCHVGAVIGADEVVAELHVAAGELYLADAHRERLGFVRRGCCCRGGYSRRLDTGQRSGAACVVVYHDIEQVQPAVRVDQQPCVEVVERDALDCHVAVAGGDTIELQRPPVDEIGGIHFIEAGQPVNACVAGEAEAGFRPGAETQFTAAADIATGERDVQPLAEIRLQRHQLDGTGAEPQIGCQWLRPQCAAELELAAAVDARAQFDARRFARRYIARLQLQLRQPDVRVLDRCFVEKIQRVVAECQLLQAECPLWCRMQRFYRCRVSSGGWRQPLLQVELALLIAVQLQLQAAAVDAADLQFALRQIDIGLLQVQRRQGQERLFALRRQQACIAEAELQLRQADSLCVDAELPLTVEAAAGEADAQQIAVIRRVIGQCQLARFDPAIECERLQLELPLCCQPFSPIGTQRGTETARLARLQRKLPQLQVDRGEAGGETGPVVLPVQLTLLQGKGVKRELQCRAGWLGCCGAGWRAAWRHTERLLQIELAIFAALQPNFRVQQAQPAQPVALLQRLQPGDFQFCLLPAEQRRAVRLLQFQLAHAEFAGQCDARCLFRRLAEAQCQLAVEPRRGDAEAQRGWQVAEIMRYIDVVEADIDGRFVRLAERPGAGG